jgi:hypothetical protein
MYIAATYLRIDDTFHNYNKCHLSLSQKGGEKIGRNLPFQILRSLDLISLLYSKPKLKFPKNNEEKKNFRVSTRLLHPSDTTNMSD